MERVELPETFVTALREALKGAKKVALAILEPEDFRNVVPLYLGEVGEVKGEEVLEAEGERKLKLFPAGSYTVALVEGEEVLEIVLLQVPIEKVKKFLKGEEEYEADESAYEAEEAEEEEEEAEPE